MNDRTSGLSRFRTFREASYFADCPPPKISEAAPPSERLRRKRTPTGLAKEITELSDGLDDAALEDGITEDLLGLQIDRQLAPKVIDGNGFQDRAAHLSADFYRDLGSEVEKSLLQQEGYDDFRARMLDKMGLGIEGPERLGVLRDIANGIRNEARVGWNEGLAALNRTAETDAVWSCMLLPTSTPGCVWRHGKRIDADLGGETMPRHSGCKCQVVMVPSIDSDDPDTAAQGQEILDTMAAERDDWESATGETASEMEEAYRPTRFRNFRQETVVRGT